MTRRDVFSPSRLDRSALAGWWWSVDRVTLGLVAAIAAIGFVLVLAAGPGAAARLGIEASFYFPLRQVLFLVPAAAVLIGASMMTPLQARRAGALIFAGALGACVLALIAAPEINGAKRWLPLGGFALQPSELLKPGFIVVAAWMIAEGARDPKFPGAPIAMGLFAASLALLVAQPDYGQAALLTAVWMVMFFIAGWSVIWLAGLAASGVAVLGLGYFFSAHVADRVDGFFAADCSTHDGFQAHYQVCMASDAIATGGLAGRNLEGGEVKLLLPDSHADFIFAVAGEQYGFFFCLLIIALYAAFTARAFTKAAAQTSVFAQCAACGLAAAIGLQAFINMAVSLRALPAKGMTLPFVSYGGSSLIASALTVGLILALTRRRPPARRRREIMP